MPNGIKQINKKKKQAVRLWQPAVMLGYRRAQRKSDPSISLVAIKGVKCRSDTKWYMGKKVLYIFKGYNKVRAPRSQQAAKLLTKKRRIWGKIVMPHGKNGVVRCRFSPNLPSHAISRRIRVYMFPSFN